MNCDDERSLAHKELTEALDRARDAYRRDFARIIAEEPSDTAYSGAARSWKRERDQAWRDYRLRIAEIRRAERRAAEAV